MNDQPFFRIEWVIDNADVLALATLEHVVLTLIAMAGGILIAFPITIFIHRRRRLIGPVLGSPGSVRDPEPGPVRLPRPGDRAQPADRRDRADQLHPADPHPERGGRPTASSRRSWRRPPAWAIAVASGCGGWSPLAIPVIMAGIRVATVTTIGLVAVTALIGQGGLGFVIITLASVARSRPRSWSA